MRGFNLVKKWFVCSDGNPSNVPNVGAQGDSERAATCPVVFVRTQHESLLIASVLVRHEGVYLQLPWEPRLGLVVLHLGLNLPLGSSPGGFFIGLSLNCRKTAVRLRHRRSSTSFAMQWEENMVLRSGLAVPIALLLLGSSAQAQGAAKACASDIKTLCADVRPGKGRIAGCVKDHMKDLSEPCQNLLATTAAAAKTCTADVKQHCADAQRRTEKISCLKSALLNLSDECKSAISQVAAGRR
jgi:hypothetical protein